MNRCSLFCKFARIALQNRSSRLWHKFVRGQSIDKRHLQVVANYCRLGVRMIPEQDGFRRQVQEHIKQTNLARFVCERIVTKKMSEEISRGEWE